MIRKTLTLVSLFTAVALAQSGPPLPSPQSPVWVSPASAVTGGGAVTSAQILAPDGSASAPSYSFASDPDTGFYWTTSNQMLWSAGGSATILFSGTQFRLGTDNISLAFGGSGDVVLSRGAANRLDLATGDSWNMVGAGGSFQMATVPIISSAAPTVTSAGTSPSIAGTNTAAFRVNVGTGGSATTIVLGMPTATTGWNCHANNITAAAANRANQTVKQQSSTTTAVTVQNQTVSTGAALAFTASDIVAFVCMAY